MQPVAVFFDPDKLSVTFSLPHRFTESGYDQLIQAAEPYLEKCNLFTIDLSHTEQLDTVVLGSFLVLRERAESRDGNVILLNPAGQVLSILERANFSALFSIEYSAITYDI